MSLKSMTGFGCGEASAGSMKVEVELSSVNRRQFDARVGLPRGLVSLESRVSETIHRYVSRGFVTGNVRISVVGKGNSGCVAVNMSLASEYVKALRLTAGKLGLHDDLTVLTVARFPEVVSYRSAAEDSEKVWRLLKKALRSALVELVRMREMEGSEIEKDIMDRFGRLSTRVSAIRQLAPAVRTRYLKSLKRRIRESGVKIQFDDQQVLREVALFADRSDISEEIVRLKSHIKQARALIKSKDSSGRALDFICQEMFREINTIGSKGSDKDISKHVIAFKAELESAREQVQNVE